MYICMEMDTSCFLCSRFFRVRNAAVWDSVYEITKRHYEALEWLGEKKKTVEHYRASESQATYSIAKVPPSDTFGIRRYLLEKDRETLRCIMSRSEKVWSLGDSSSQSPSWSLERDPSLRRRIRGVVSMSIISRSGDRSVSDYWIGYRGGRKKLSVIGAAKRAGCP